MAFSWKRPNPVRNTVLALLLAIVAELILRALGYRMITDLGILKRFFMVLMLAVLAVDFCSSLFETSQKPATHKSTEEEDHPQP